MLPLIPSPNIDQSLLHLDAEEQMDPVSVLAELCAEYSPGETRSLFTTMQHITLLDDQCNDPRERDTQLFFGERVLKTLEACYLICRDRSPT